MLMDVYESLFQKTWWPLYLNGMFLMSQIYKTMFVYKDLTCLWAVHKLCNRNRGEGCQKDYFCKEGGRKWSPHIIIT